MRIVNTGPTLPPAYDEWLADGRAIAGIGPLIAHRLRASSDAGLTESALLAFPEFDCRNDLAIVEPYLRCDSPGERSLAARAIGLCGDESHVAALLAVAQRDDNGSVRAGACYAIRQIVVAHPPSKALGARVEEQLTAVAAHDQDTTARQAAREALAALPGKR